MTTKYKLLHRTHWDNNSAESREWWTLYEYRKGFFGHRSWHPVKVDKYGFDGMSYKTNATGNREWAKKIAKHYNIAMPDEN